MWKYIYLLLLNLGELKSQTDEAYLAKPIGNQFSSNIKTYPIVLWWTEKIFPHFQGDTDVINCPKGSCVTTTNKKLLTNPRTRGILFYGTDFRAYEAPLPRMPQHEWALFHEESPMNNYILSHNTMIRMFNHTATFRRESDFPLTSHPIPSLQYLTQRKSVPLQEKNVLRQDGAYAAVLYVQSHCGIASDRDRYITELMKYIPIDSYGKCLNNKDLPADLQDTMTMDHPDFLKLISGYKFHLAFENAICDDYMTEKLFRTLHVGSVPIYRGSAKARDWMPSNKSIIMVDDFKTPEKLANYIKMLDENDELYSEYLQYKDDGINNEFLINHISKRTWGINVVGKDDFITGFECYVCDRVIERINNQTLPPRIASYAHMGCPEPDVSYGSRDDVPMSDEWRMWKEDFWGHMDQAHALQHMMNIGEKDSSKLFDYLEEMMHNRRQ
ncbi:GDP-fucose protein O-fucosyltransferase 4-like [Saccoglossus kowalevskii]|uniref:Fucosyltransferase n=1 Tax=Saccoglossus kowalevskii TaxID=10224 RepID=A0ABM0GMD1_SACKO|nr:PREDICTED: alpha-(1,3)-fucosyltransferase 11-like [Saccoglossus kowalevskii]